MAHRLAPGPHPKVWYGHSRCSLRSRFGQCKSDPRIRNTFVRAVDDTHHVQVLTGGRWLVGRGLDSSGALIDRQPAERWSIHGWAECPRSNALIMRNQAERNGTTTNAAVVRSAFMVGGPSYPHATTATSRASP